MQNIEYHSPNNNWEKLPIFDSGKIFRSVQLEFSRPLNTSQGFEPNGGLGSSSVFVFSKALDWVYINSRLVVLNMIFNELLLFNVDVVKL